MKNSGFILLLIILLSLLLRLSFLGSYPNGLSNDESAFGYNAYSILKTGRDEYGSFLPVSFKSFGEYKAPLYIYATVPFIGIFGISEFSVRITSVIFSIGTVIIAYLLVRQLTKNKNLALLVSFILAIVPWHIQFSRIAYEDTSSLFILTLAVFCFTKGLKSTKYFIVSFILFGLALYTHYSVRLFIPLFVLYLIIIFKKFVFDDKKRLLLGVVAGFITVALLIPSIFSDSFFSRAKYISLFTDAGLISKINEEREQFNWGNNGSRFGDIIYNKPVEFTKQFIINYISHFNPTFLFYEGDGDTIFQTPHTGPLLFALLPFLVIGIFQINKYRNLAFIIWGWLLLSVIPSSLTRLSGSTNRAFIMLIPLCVLIALGLNYLVQFAKSKKYCLLITLYLTVVVLEYAYYLNNYYFILPVRREYDQRVANPTLISLLKENIQNYNTIWINDNPQAYIQYLYYLDYDPSQYQKEANLSTLDEFGFGKVKYFGKFYFEGDYKPEESKTLYISRNEREPAGFTLKEKIYRIDNGIAYYIYEN